MGQPERYIKGGFVTDRKLLDELKNNFRERFKKEKKENEMEKISIKLFSVKDKRRNFWSDTNQEPVPAHSPVKEKKIIPSKNVICEGHKEMAGETVCPWCVLTFNLVKERKETERYKKLVAEKDRVLATTEIRLAEFRKSNEHLTDECNRLRKRYESHMKMEEHIANPKKKPRTIIF